MKNTADPSIHRAREQQLVAHVLTLLDDPRFRLDTINGHRAISTVRYDAPHRYDRGTDVKRTMIDMGLPDPELQKRMPLGEQLEVTLWQKRLLLFKKVVGRLRVVCVSPTRTLLKGETPQPMTTQDINKTLSEIPPALGGVPTTVVLLSTAGFTIEAHTAAVRSQDRTLVLVEPNDAGGWSVYGPPETKGMVDLFDPEAENAKRQRVRKLIEDQKVDLLSSGIATDKLAAKAQLPLQMVEAELKSYAKESPGLTTKRMDGRLVLFRTGSSAATAPVKSTGPGATMPLIDRIKTIFARKGETEKKIAILSEQKAAFSQQLDRAYEEIGALEKRDTELRDEFKSASGAVTKRRVTSQLVQLRKDIERRQQLVSVLNQRVNVVATHLHNLELVRSDESAKMPDSEEIANDAAAAEEMLAQLQADNEVAQSVGGIAQSGMSEEEQALFEELERESGGTTKIESPEPAELPSVEKPRTTQQKSPARESAPPPIPRQPEPEKRRTDPEPG
jgi:hypothetical protein